MAETVEDAFKVVKKAIEEELKKSDFTVKSSGTKNSELSRPLDEETGFWGNPASVISKPPRWIIHFEKVEDTVIADFAKNEDGVIFPGAKTVGYLNNREGNCSAFIFKTHASLKESNGSFKFPNWEWLIAMIFNNPLPAGTSSQTLSNFEPSEGTVMYSEKPYPIKTLAIFRTPPEFTDTVINDTDNITYDEATEALKTFLGATNEEEN